MMKHNIQYSLLFLIILIVGCNTGEKIERLIRQSNYVFPKGEKITSNNFTGTVWVKMMGTNDSALNARFGNVTFEPMARTNWHSHPGGQILLITEGQGYYKAQGQPARLLGKGDVVEILPNVVHWHGASPNSEFAHIAISLNTDKGGTVWLQPVTEKEYPK